MNIRLVLLASLAFVFGALVAITTLQLTGGNRGAMMTQIEGTPRIGGPFQLTDHTGKRVTEKDFAGRFMLVFFGYTYCPDICPGELQVMTAALEHLGEKGKKVTPVFVTIDPRRDTAEQMASYVSNFHERLVGLTGSFDEIRAIAKAYGVYYARAKGDDSSTEYLMDHTSIVYLMGPDGQYKKHFSYGTDPKKMAEGISEFL